MRSNTKDLPTHLVGADSLTCSGGLLRRFKLDELPQLFNVIKGDMSLVGPRPGLPGHFELTSAREKCGVFDVKPGITGLAQISGVDMSIPGVLAKLDREMIEGLTLVSYFKYLVATFIGRGNGDRVREL